MMRGNGVTPKENGRQDARPALSPSRGRHDVNNLLTTILGNAQYARLVHPDLPGDVLVSLQRIEASARRIQDLLADSNQE